MAGLSSPRDGPAAMDGGEGEVHDGLSRNDCEVQFSISIRIPGYKAILDDGSRTDLEPKDHILDVNVARGYSVQIFLNDLAAKLFGAVVRSQFSGSGTVRRRDYIRLSPMQVWIVHFKCIGPSSGWLRKKPSLGAADLQDKLLDKYNVEVGYETMLAGRQQAIDAIFGA